MTKEELKRDLYSYRDIVRELAQVRRQREMLEARMTSPRSGVPGGSGRGSGGDPMVDMVARSVRLEQKYKQLESRLLAAQLGIENLISRLGPKERTLLRHYYLEGLTMEQVGDKMGYTERQAHRVHASALGHLLERCHGMSWSDVL